MASLLSGFGIDYFEAPKTESLIFKKMRELQEASDNGLETFLEKVNVYYPVTNIEIINFQHGEEVEYRFYSGDKFVATLNKCYYFNDDKSTYDTKWYGEIKDFDKF